jgi:hypothetical protein
MRRLGKTLLAYSCLEYLFVKTLWKKLRDRHILACAYCLIKNLSMRNSYKTHKGKEYNVMT